MDVIDLTGVEYSLAAYGGAGDRPKLLALGHELGIHDNHRQAAQRVVERVSGIDMRVEQTFRSLVCQPQLQFF
ncbi:hypothetical protein SDC9_211049 [bioreactor metagenome]|uniref:Uncharacterized protein n=1 Tax=bioreactor metagenome TaxID=1076179 RepID=A0A645JJ88_9ZZZZ